MREIRQVMQVFSVRQGLKWLIRSIVSGGIKVNQVRSEVVEQRAVGQFWEKQLPAGTMVRKYER